MTIRIEPLSAFNKLAFARLLEGADFGHAPEWKSCYCRFYHTDMAMPDWISRTMMDNKTASFEAIDAGQMKGYLAFEDDLPIGWVNANSLQSYPRLKKIASAYPVDAKIGLTICFVVHPDYRGQGIAGKLLDAAIEGFRQAGFDQVIALPFEDAVAARMYRGRLEMYRHRGYVIKDVKDGVCLVELLLNS
jgi:GNAT superfamily N-acetyltransferase